MRTSESAELSKDCTSEIGAAGRTISAERASGARRRALTFHDRLRAIAGVIMTYTAWEVAMTSMSRSSTEAAWSSAPVAVECRAPVVTRRSSLELGVVPAAVRTARHWTASLLSESNPAHDADVIDTIILLVSEMVTNAITAVTQPGTVPAQSRGREIPAGKPRVWLALAGSPQQVRIEVHDSACLPVPVMCRPSLDDVSGRGLEVIAALASDWGWHPDPYGKVVWCELNLHSPSGRTFQSA